MLYQSNSFEPSRAPRRVLSFAAAMLFTLSGSHVAMGQAEPAPTPAEPAPPAQPPPAETAPPATEPAPPADPVPVEPAPVEPAPVEPTPAADPAPVEEAPAAPAAVEPAPEAAPAEPMPVAEPPAAEEPAPEPNPVNVGVWGRIDFTLNDPDDPEKLGDISSTGVAEFHFSGSLMDKVGYTANLVASYGGGTISGTAGLMDAIIEVGFDDAFNVWGGRMLVPSDRSNFSGSWFMMAWDYPGLYEPGAPPVGPAQGPNGRNDGATVWGNILDGHLKYYVGAYDLHDVSTNPLISARVNIALLNPEAGYYSNSTYLGGKDILALGLGFQSKAGEEVTIETVDDDGETVTSTSETDDYSLFNADILYEKNFGEDAGTLNAEGAFYAFSGDDTPIKTHLFAVLSYLIPGKVGPGQLMPLVRFQTATTRGDEDTWTIIEGYLNYIPKGFNFNTSLGFVSKNLESYDGGDDYKSNELKLGLQWIH